jgi:hypothetical protein
MPRSVMMMMMMIGATGRVIRGLRTNLEAIPGNLQQSHYKRYTKNITHNVESTAVSNLKPEWLGSLLVQEKYQGEEDCDKKHYYFFW